MHALAASACSTQIRRAGWIPHARGGLDLRATREFTSLPNQQTNLPVRSLQLGFQESD